MTPQTDNSDWPENVLEEFIRNQENGVVGSVLVSESERVRVWHIRLAPGERMPFHRHALDYFWTALTPGRTISHQQNGSTSEHTYEVGETFHSNFKSGEYMYHDLENVGDTELVFTTVEFLESANTPIKVPDDVRADSSRKAA